MPTTTDNTMNSNAKDSNKAADMKDGDKSDLEKAGDKTKDALEKRALKKPKKASKKLLTQLRMP